MVTISMNDSGPFSVKNMQRSKSTQKVEVCMNNSTATCRCPICNKELVIEWDAIIKNACKHYIGVQGMNPFWTLFFDKEECTIFEFDEIQDTVLRIQGNSNRKKIVTKLNSSDYKEAISAEWEVVIARWLSKLGNFEYEKRNSKGRNPDIFWESLDKKIKLSADVKTVFDQFDRDYPAFEFCSEARSIMMEYIPSSWACAAYFDSKEKGVPEIFPESRFPQNLAILKAEIQKIQDTVSCENTYTFTVEGHRISFFLSEVDGYGCCGYRSRYYDRYDKNPLYNGLKRKACQLVKDENNLLGIFLCDGKTNTINSNVSSIYAVKIQEILNNFFNEESHINFVALLGISNPPISTLKFEFHLNPYIDQNIDAQRLKIFLERKAHLFSKHRDYPGHVQQKIAHTKNEIRKMFCT